MSDYTYNSNSLEQREKIRFGTPDWERSSYICECVLFFSKISWKSVPSWKEVCWHGHYTLARIQSGFRSDVHCNIDRMSCLMASFEWFLHSQNFKRKSQACLAIFKKLGCSVVALKKEKRTTNIAFIVWERIDCKFKDTAMGGTNNVRFESFLWLRSISHVGRSFNKVLKRSRVNR